ncbi:MAG: fibronectin type III domain-containing protein [Betaproteobacteria bacterium]|nr:fibronectin type III domain-containing protein [Betaproteobacteria bacterium]
MASGRFPFLPAIRAFAGALALAAGLQALPAQALNSAFLAADPAAAQVMAGTPYDMHVTGWRQPNGNIDRGTFAYKLYSAFLMLGYQTEMGSGYGLDDSHLRCLHLFQSRAGLPVSDVVNAATLAQIDAQLVSREAALAPIAASFLLSDRMQPLHVHEASRDTVRAIYALALDSLPAGLRTGHDEFIQCTSFQCLGEIQDAAGTPIYANYGQGGAWIDPASDYRFVGAYFDLRKDTARRPSAAVDVGTAIHEYAHYLDGSFGRAYAPSAFPAQVPLWRSVDTFSFYAIGYDLATYANGCLTRRSEDPRDWISKYAFNPGYGGCAAGKYVPAEDFAESFAFYVTAGRRFRAAAAGSALLAQRYAWLRNNLFAGVEYDTDLAGDVSSGCNDVHGFESQQPGYIRCDDGYVWDFTLPVGTAAGVPGAPVITGVVAGDAQASVSFAAPGFDGGSPILSYTVIRSPGGATVNAASSPVTVSGLTNGTGYSFTVSATNAIGNGPASTASSVVVPSGLPGAPAIGTATAGIASASVAFTAPASTGGLAITGYTVTASPGGFTGSGASSPVAVAGLANGTAYTFTVRASNANGAGPASATSNSVTPAGLMLPAESFDGVASPLLPASWQSLVGIHADAAWSTTGTTHHPADVPTHSGTNLVLFNSHDADAGSTARLVSPPFSLAGVTGAKLAFWMYRDAADTKSDRVDVYVNTGTTLGGAALLGTIHRFRGWSPGTGNVGWQQFVFDLPASYAGASNHVIFDGVTSGGGQDMLLDDIVVATLPGAPVITSTVAGNGQVTLGFSVPASNGGAPITAYVASCSGGNTTTATSAYSPVVVTGLAGASSYTCTVAATNAVGTGPSSPSVIATTASAPAVTSGATATFTVNAHRVVYLTASGSPAPAISLEGTLPAGLAYYPATGMLSGTPACGSVGTYPLTVVASNGAPPEARAALTLTVQKAPQQAVLAMTPAATVGRTAVLATYSTSMLPVTVHSLTPAVCTVEDSWRLTAVSAGTCTLSLDQEGNADFLPAPQVLESFAIAAGMALAPLQASALPGEASVSLSFSPPANDGGSAITGYTATCQPGGLTASGPSSPLAIGALANGATVRCTVVANNAAGAGEATGVLLATPGPAAGPFALVTNMGVGNVSAIDLSTRRVVATVAVGASPFGIAFEPAGQRAWITDQGGTTIRALDLGSWNVSAPVTVGSYPYGIAIDPAGAYAVVSLMAEGKVAFVDLATHAVQAVAVGPSPAGVALDGARVVVANSGSNTVSVIDALTRTVTRTVTVGSTPFGVALSPSGTKAYAANWGDGSLSSVDLATGAVVTAPVGMDVFAVAVEPTGRQVVVTGQGDGVLAVFDAATLAPERVVTGVGFPAGVDTTAGVAYVVDMVAPALSLVDLATGAITASVDLGEPMASPAGFGRFVQPAALPPPPPPPPPPPVTYALTVTKAGDGAGRVISNPAGVDCGATCAGSWTAGTQVQLSAAAGEGAFFDGWAGACSGTGPCTVTLDAARAVTATFRPNTAIPRLANIATRMQVRTGNDVLIGGFVVGGTLPKTVVVRARGPSLAAFGITHTLADPQLQLFAGATPIGANNDWADDARAAQLQATGYAPSDAREAALLVTLAPGAYTAIVSGVGGGTGVGIVEIFEVDRPETPLSNISTRGQVLTGNDVMIGGFVIQGDRPQTVVVRARGPSLAAAGIANALDDPELQLFAGPGVIAYNGDWQASADAAAISARGLAPADPREAVILVTLAPGAYTAIVSGRNGATGVGIIEVFAQ